MVMELVRDDTRPSSDPDARGVRERDRRRRRHAAARRTACCTCSRSRARPASPLELDDFDTISSQTPIVADLKPFGRYVATDLQEAGGVGLVARELVGAGRIHADERGVDGRTLGEVGDGGRRAARPGRRRLVRARRIQATGGIAILRGSLAPEGCVVKLAGHERAAPPRPGARLRLARRSASPRSRRARSSRATWS